MSKRWILRGAVYLGLLGLALVAGCVPDCPDLACFVDAGAWNPTGAWINDIAAATVGTVASCVPSGGKPYYQMVLGLDTLDKAKLMCWTIRTWGLADSRDAWCSETISFWHHQAGIPYPMGYRNDTWHLSTQCPNTVALQTFYMVEELLPHGRGRWIAGQELNYDDFRPGENAPAPGSYVFIREYDAAKKEWESRSHSMMVDTMTVHRAPSGQVTQVEVTLLEGNGGDGHEVRWRPGGIDDLRAATLAGSEECCSGRKIVGFGIDLDRDGHAIFDPGRLKVISSTTPITLPSSGGLPWITANELVLDLRQYAMSLAGVDLGVPNGTTCQRTIPKGTGCATIDIDLRQEHPLKIKGIFLCWSHAGVPEQVKAYWAGDDGEYHYAQVPWLALLKSAAGTMAEIARWDPDIAVPVLFEEVYPSPFEYYKLEGHGVRYVRLDVQADPNVDLALVDVQFAYVWEGDPDAEEDPEETISPV